MTRRLRWTIWMIAIATMAAVCLTAGNALADVTIDASAQEDHECFESTGAAVVFISDQVGYVFYLDAYDATSGIPVYRKTTDGGATWGSQITISAQTDIEDIGGIWYDRWTPGDSTGTKIYIAYADNTNDAAFFNSLDTSNDTLSGEVQVSPDLGTFNQDDGHTSIIKATDGDLYIYVAGSVTQDVYKSSNGGATWTATSATFLTDDLEQGCLMPLSGGDILLMWYDIDAVDPVGPPIVGTIFSYVLSDAGTWDSTPATVAANVIHYSHAWSSTWGATINRSTGDVYLVVNTRPVESGVTRDVETYFYDESARSWSAKTDVLTATSDRVEDVKLSIDENTGDIYCIYHQWYGSGQIVYKKSTDGMTSWGAPVQISSVGDDHRVVRPNIMSYDRIYAVWFNDDLKDVIGETVVDLNPVSFTDVTSAAGVGSLDVDYGMAWGDYNNDGYVDLVTEGSGLYKNNGNGTFSAGPALTRNGRACHWGDYDNDGDLDFGSTWNLYVSKNNGNESFTLQDNATIGFTSINNLGDFGWLDYDNDGDLDLWAANGSSPYMYMYKNDGDGTFTAVEGATIGVSANVNGECVIVGDYDGDGYTDMIYRGGAFYMWKNDGDGTFTNVSTTIGISVPNDNEGGYVGTAFGDYDNDGDLDLYIGQDGANYFYSNDGDGTFTDTTSTAGVAAGTLITGGVAWGDFNNDGYLDLYVGHKNSANNLYLNNGNDTFTDVASTYGLNDSSATYGVMWADYDNDGDLDLFVGNNASNSKLFKNNLDNTHYLKVKVTGSGSGGSPKDGTGARVELYDSSGTTLLATREVFGAEGYGSHSPRIQHFGLAKFGGGSGTYVVKVKFTSGTTKTIPNVVPTNESITIGATTVPNTIEVFEGNNAPSTPQTPYCEGATNPTGVTDASPEFSAIFDDPETSDTAIYYEIEVDTASAFNGTRMWDTGKTALSPALAENSRSTDVSYAGTALSFDGSTYYWRIRFWDNSDAQGAWSATQQFTMATNGPPSAPQTPYCEGVTNPGSVTDLTPEFSAIYDDPDTSDTAEYYEIEVSDGPSFSPGANWWDANYGYRQSLTVSATDAVDAGYSVKTTIDTAALETAGKVRSDRNDWRIVYAPSDSLRSLSFDGVDDYVSTESSDLMANLATFTVEAWVKSNGTQTDWAGLVEYRGTTGTSFEMALEVRASGAIRLAAYTQTTGVATLDSTSTLSTGVWTHVAGVYDGSDLKIYINGSLDATSGSVTGNLRNNNRKVYIGRNPEDGVTFDGLIDEVRISNNVRYTANFTPQTTPFTPDANTLLLMHFDEGSGIHVIDDSGQGNHGIMNGINNVYYVRKTGSDTNSGLRASDAWLTIGKAASTMVAGDVVYVGAGTYYEMVQPSNSGTASQYIYYIADVSGAHTGDAGAVIIDGENTRARSFELSSDNYIVIDGFEHYNVYNDGGGGANILASNCTNVIIRNNIFRDTGRDGIGLGSSTNCLVENNLIYNIADDGITPGSNNTIRNNTIYNCNGWAIEGAAGTGLVYENNIIWDTMDSTSLTTANYNNYIGSVLTGTGNISSDPLFINAAGGDFHLSHIAAGQGSDSPCIDAGGVTAASLQLDKYSTRSDNGLDSGTVDMGYHYRVSQDYSNWPLRSTDGKVSTTREIDRDYVGTAETWFKLQAPIAASGSDGEYFAYYGYSGETSSPQANTMNVYHFHEDFNRADSSTIGNNWIEWNDGTGDMYLSSNTLKLGGADALPPDTGIKHALGSGLTNDFVVTWAWTIPTNGEGTWATYFNIGDSGTMVNSDRTAGVGPGLYIGENLGLTGTYAVDNDMSGALENDIYNAHTFELRVNVAASTYDYYRDGVLRSSSVAWANSSVGLNQIRIASDNFNSSPTTEHTFDDIKIRYLVSTEPSITPGSEEASVTLMWDTGKTAIASLAENSRSTDVSYAGTALSFDGSTYYWRIRFWDNSDAQGAWSATQNFTMSSNQAPTANSADLTGLADPLPNKALTITAKYSDADGAADLNNLYLKIDHPTATDIEYYGVEGATASGLTPTAVSGATYVSSITYDRTSGSPTANDITVTWNITLGWNWTDATDIEFGVRATDDDAADSGYSTTTTANKIYDNELTFSGTLAASGSVQGALTSGDWVQGGETISWSGLTVVYQNTSTSPANGDFDIRIIDDDTGSWTQTTGAALSLATTADASTDTSDVHNIDIINIPAGGADASAQTWEVKVDADNPTVTGVACYADTLGDGAAYDDDTTVGLQWTESDGAGSGIASVNACIGTTPPNESVGVGAQSDTDIGVEGSNTYYVQITDNVGHTSIIGSDTITIDLTDPTVPGNLTFNSKTSTSVTLDFGAQTTETNFDTYKIFYKQGTSGVTESDTEHVDANLGYINYNGASSTTISNLTTDQFYTFNIWAYDLAGRKASATEITVFVGDCTITSTTIDYDDGVNAVSWGQISWTDTETNGSIIYQVEYYTGSAWALIPDVDLAGNSTGFGTSPIDISGLNTTTYNQIRLRATFTYSAGTPILSDWTCTWITDATPPVIDTVTVTSSKPSWFSHDGVDLGPTGGTVYFNSAPFEGEWQDLTVTVGVTEANPTSFQGATAFNDSPAADTSASGGWTQTYSVDQNIDSQSGVVFTFTDIANNTDTATITFEMDNADPTAGTLAWTASGNVTSSGGNNKVYISGTTLYYSSHSAGETTGVTLQVTGAADNGSGANPASGLKEYQFPAIFGKSSGEALISHPTTTCTYTIDSSDSGAGTFSATTYDAVNNSASTGNITLTYDITVDNNVTTATETGGAQDGVAQDTVSDPAFTWTEPNDAGSGVAGYYWYFGTNSAADPVNYNWTTLTSADPPAVTTYDRHYLRIKTKDNVGNISQAATVFTFIYIPYAPPTTDRSTSTWYQGDKDIETFDFSHPDVGTKFTRFYYKWDRNATYTITTADSGDWTTTSKSFTPYTSKSMYLHIAPANSSDDLGPQSDLGPYYFVDTERLLKHGYFFDDDGTLQRYGE